MSIATAEDVRLDPESHVYYRGLQKLTSVSRIIKTFMPTDFSAVDPAVLENARSRGIELDTLFCQYVEGTLRKIPAGTRRDVFDPDTKDGLLQKLMPWWDRLGIKARTQVTLADEDTAGTCDLLSDEWIFDLKCVSQLQPSYELQLGGYRALHGGTRRIAVIHIKKDMREPKLIEFAGFDCERDFRCIRDAYRVVTRRTA